MNKKYQIFLSGGGDEHQSFPLDKLFFDSLPQNGMLLYIPIALRGHKLFSTAGKWSQSVIELHGRNDVNLEVMDNPSIYNYENLKTFDGVYIGGGNTWSLMKELNDSGFSDVLIKYINSGGKVYGGSAGAIIFGKRIDTHDDEKVKGYNDTSGLDVLDNYSIACHFNEDQKLRFKKWSIDNNLSIMCLTEESGIIVKDGNIKYVGAKPCMFYSDRGIEETIKPNS